MCITCELSGPPSGCHWTLQVVERNVQREERVRDMRNENIKRKMGCGMGGGRRSQRQQHPHFGSDGLHVIISFHFISYHSLPDQYRSLAVLMVSKHKLLIVYLLLQTADKHFVNHDKHRLDSGRGLL